MKRFIIVIGIDQESEEALRATVNLAGDNVMIHSLYELTNEQEQRIAETCLHNTQQRVGNTAFWCANCGALTRNGLDWKLPARPIKIQASSMYGVIGKDKPNET